MIRTLLLALIGATVIPTLVMCAWYDEIQKVYRNWLVFNDVPARVAV